LRLVDEAFGQRVEAQDCDPAPIGQRERRPRTRDHALFVGAVARKREIAQLLRTLEPVELAGPGRNLRRSDVRVPVENDRGDIVPVAASQLV